VQTVQTLRADRDKDSAVTGPDFGTCSYAAITLRRNNPHLYKPNM